MNFDLEIFNKIFKELEIALTEKNEKKIQKLWVQCIDLCPTYSQLLKLINIAKHIGLDGLELHSTKKIKIAILAQSTVTQFKEVLAYNLKMRGFDVEIYESPFDSIEQEILNSNSYLYSWQPDYILLWPEKIDLNASEAWEKLRHWHSMLGERLPKAQLIQTTLSSEPERPLGYLESRLGWSKTNIANDLNYLIRRQTDKPMLVLDLDLLSAKFGKNLWFDKRLWFHSKYSFSFDALAMVSNELAKMICAMAGVNYKCLVLDLDNTLWGGSIDEDGPEGISLGESGAGEAFVDFQAYIKSLKNRGVILAVCSKNEMLLAQEVFHKNSQMVLKEEDISFFVANWNDKVSNLKCIAENLGISTDSLVFFDDNPAERMLVRDLLPEVYTVEVPADPALYIRALDSLNLFDVVELTEEDLSKTKQYSANSARKGSLKNTVSLTDYLKSLEMKGLVIPVDESNYQRPLQLLNKSNQFNLMTNRYTQSEFLNLLKHEGVTSVGYRLIDKFGDNGLIAVVVTQKRDEILYILDWVMSCRVLCRGMEYFTFSQIVQMALENDCLSIRASFCPTKKNKLVSGLLQDIGMTYLDTSFEKTQYQLVLDQPFMREHYIEKIFGAER